MKKATLLVIVLLIGMLSGCKILRERLLAPPDEWTAPDGTQICSCDVDDIEYRYVYKDDGIYQFFIDDVLQSEEEINNIQEQAYLNGESVYNYLIITHNISDCTIEDYYPEE